MEFGAQCHNLCHNPLLRIPVASEGLRAIFGAGRVGQRVSRGQVFAAGLLSCEVLEAAMRRVVAQDDRGVVLEA